MSCLCGDPYCPSCGTAQGTLPSWLDFHPGQRVIVERGIGRTERELLGKVGTVVRITKPHGFAVIKIDQGREYAVHPEALDHLEGEERGAR